MSPVGSNEANPVGVHEESISHWIDMGEWEKAAFCLAEALRKGVQVTDRLAILAAAIFSFYGKYEDFQDWISQGLAYNPYNYELYLMLGDYYTGVNRDMAFLCYENALWHCERTVGREHPDYQSIAESAAALLEAPCPASDSQCKNSERPNPVLPALIEEPFCLASGSLYKDLEQPKFSLINENGGIHVRRVSFVILSYNTLEYTRQCIESIREHCPAGSYEIVVVDNASSDGSREWLEKQKDLVLVLSDVNLGFPAGCNAGIRAARFANDIFLLNNDVVMMPNALFTARLGLYSDEAVGCVGCMQNENLPGADVFLRQASGQNIPRRNALEDKIFLSGFAMLIRREALDLCGLLDERFSPGNYEDTDLSLRLVQAGYRNVLCHNSLLYHYKSRSFAIRKGGMDEYAEIMKRNRGKFHQKWGFDTDYYSNVRSDLTGCMEKILEEEGRGKDEKFEVVECGCGMGETLFHVQYLFPRASVHGIELNGEMAAFGKRRLDILVGDLESLRLPYERASLDFVLFGDVLEHLRDPRIVLSFFHDCLKDGGHVVASIPNILNIKVIHSLLQGNFTYQEEGILDRTHLRFFTLKEIYRLFESAGFTIQSIRSRVLDEESTAVPAYGKLYGLLTAMEGVAAREQFDAYQYIVIARKACKGRDYK